ncbi:MAG: hypothetical protein UZ10_BCD003000590 [Bacteroidetes bacterium OLB10]|nr:MAG: hypothetical protein UZ10_BCD003000590 [Bacteroidetes bacterium OLB10]MBX3106077.1 hypothetical protein [Bacteroidota bacterium]MCB0848869.1 hypothetical protein [Bacteroidota bacterium]MCB8931520.1 hypothetical protein [Bacteroidia bacterium]MCW5931342.1 hypothetical protein [Bacteroidota bacterium]
MIDTFVIVYQPGFIAKIFIATLVLMIAGELVQAQIGNTFAEAFEKKPKPFFQLDGYNSFVRKRGANAIGVKAGLGFNKKLRFGIGYMKLFTDVVDSIEVKPGTYYRGEVKSGYFTTGLEYILYDNDPWQLSFPVHLGIGNSYYDYPDGKRTHNKALKGSIVLLEPAVTGHYKVIRWVGVGFGVGYRIMIKNNTQITDKLSSPLYVLKLKVFLDEIYKSIFEPEDNKK